MTSGTNRPKRIPIKLTIKQFEGSSLYYILLFFKVVEADDDIPIRVMVQLTFVWTYLNEFIAINTIEMPAFDPAH